MSEKLTIKNFGPIKSVKLELRKFNVIIGENATGKSTIAKVFVVCRYFSYIADNTSIKFSKTTSPFFQGLTSWGLSDFLKEDTYIYYDCNDYSFKVQRKNSSLVSKDEAGNIMFSTDDYKIWNFTLKEKSKRFANLLKELKKIQLSNEDEIIDPVSSWTIPTSFYQNDVASVLDNPFYLPTERGLQSIFSLGKNSIQNIADSLFNQFANLDSVARNFKNEISIEPLDISYKNIEGRGYIKKNSEKEFFNLYSGASGFKSAIPIVLAVKYYNEIRKKMKTFIIEEPELNLFPTVQYKLMRYLTDTTIKYNQILLSTHSPYILTSLNNLMYAFSVGKNHYEEANKIIEEKYWINPDDVSAYMLLPNGTCGEILDREENLIRAEKIDGVSGFLNEQFDALLNIELVQK